MYEVLHGQGHQCASVDPSGNREITSKAGERDTSLNILTIMMQQRVHAYVPITSEVA